MLPILLLLVLIPTVINAHSTLLSPTPRSGSFCTTSTAAGEKDCPACGWGDKTNARPAALVLRRGAKLPVRWPRNNHAGGFVRLSIVPFNAAQTQKSFSVLANVVQYSCFESACASLDPIKQPLGPDPPQFHENQNVCNVSMTVPQRLADGQYTMQWLWYGGGSWFGDLHRGVSDFYNCVDFTVRGGLPYKAQTSSSSCPSFVPGDAQNSPSKGVCSYFRSTSPFQCVSGCTGKYGKGQPHGFQTCKKPSSSFSAA